jgi:hypothetical protein
MYLGTEPRQLRKNMKQNTKGLCEKYKKFKLPSLPIIPEKVSQYSKTCLSIFVILFPIFNRIKLHNIFCPTFYVLISS